MMSKLMGFPSIYLQMTKVYKNIKHILLVQAVDKLTKQSEPKGNCIQLDGSCEHILSKHAASFWSLGHSPLNG